MTCKRDNCLYTMDDKDEKLFVLVYVDDIIVENLNLYWENCLKEIENERFRLIKKFLGIEAKKFPNKNYLLVWTEKGCFEIMTTNSFCRLSLLAN